MLNNTIIENSAEFYGGGVFSHTVSPWVINTILWSNSASKGSQLYSHASKTRVAYCNVQDSVWEGRGNINVNPFFSNSLFNLSDSSLCIGAGCDSIELSGGWVYTPLFDFDRDLRPLPTGSSPDIGAQENSLTDPISNIQNNLNIPEECKLFQNYPNPFNPITNIQFSISNSEYITLKIYNFLGQELATLVSEKLAAGQYKYTWDASSHASGVYFYKLQTGRNIFVKKMMLLK
jgi:hypothetical protein